MSARLSLCTVALCALAVPSHSRAQEAAQSMAPPKYLFITEETVKPGKRAAHEKNEALFAAEFTKSGSKSWYFAMNPMSGGSNTLYIGSANTWAEMESGQASVGSVPGLSDKLDALTDKDGDYISTARSTVAMIVPSITVGSTPDFSKVHGYRITTYRVRIGHTDEFLHARRLLKAGWEASGVDQHLGAFVVTQGVAQPTYLFFRPFTKLAEFDADSANNAALAAHSSPDSLKVYDELLEKSLLSRETDTYMISPKTSYAPATFAASDKFWDSSPTVVAARNAAKAKVTQAGSARSSKKQ